VKCYVRMNENFIYLEPWRSPNTLGKASRALPDVGKAVCGTEWVPCMHTYDLVLELGQHYRL